MIKYITSFKDSLLLETSNILQDVVELGIDSVIDNEFIKSIPIVKNLVSLKKIRDSVAERNYIKNLVLFINELNKGNIDKVKLKKHIEELDDPEKAEKELERILIILSQTIDREKAVMYGKIYKSYINQIIGWSDVVEYTEIINRMFIQDLPMLEELYYRTICRQNQFLGDRYDNYRIDRLYSLGIVGYSPKIMSNIDLGDKAAILNGMGIGLGNIIF